MNLMVLAPDVVPDLELLLPACDKSEIAPFLRSVRYRSARYEEVIRLPHSPRVYPQRLSYLQDCQDWLMVAMAHQRLGRPTQAKEWLEKAVDTLEREAKHEVIPHSRFHTPWMRSLPVEILRREAETMIQK